MVLHYTLTLDGNVQRLSSVLPGATADKVAQEQSWSYISIQADPANTHVAYVGGYPTIISSSDYGWIIPLPPSNIPAAPLQIMPGCPAVRLSEFTVIGTNAEKLHILVKD